MTYTDAAAKLTGRNRDRRKVGNNTYIERRDENTIALRLHATDIMLFHANGNITLNTGGWTTVTTKARMNEFLPDSWGISQSKGQWYITKRTDVNSWECQDVALYADGCVLQTDGTVHGAESVEVADERIALRKKVLKYSKDYIKAFRAGKVPAPGAGDCWGCLMVEVKTHKAAMGGPEHIKSHIAEKHYVPSLLLRAMETFPASIAMKDQVARVWSGDLTTSWGDFVFEQLGKIIYRYCLRELGQAS